MKLFGSGTIVRRVVELITIVIFLGVMAYELSGVPWRHLCADLFTWRTFYGLILCFLATWLIAHLDHGATLVDVVTDIPNLIVGMFFSAAILWLLYSLLKTMFEPS